ncbi:S49 family peptidase [Sediminibacter sp. Hel_I_10]|uniref:S49 family peptidase n=1 Tax=Sediminibacter sp. Hel_I_10 TaxID=1392490 RepID=UPI00047DF381|nr:S49 family peptidase [Sediminibacter sp. Hel_I_10]
MNKFSVKLLDNRTVLNEILTGHWLISHSGLLQLGHFFKTVTQNNASESKETDRSESLLSFYDDNYNRIAPRSVSEIPEGSIAQINCVGPMMKYGNWWMLGANEVIAQLDFVNNLQNVAAIVIYIDGPGGAVSAISPFIDFAKRKKKPVVAICDASLSLHRWIPDAIADVQMADNDISARFGSIGVVSSWMDATKYYEEMGVKVHEVYPEESSHKNEIWRAIQEDEEKGKQMLRDMHLSPMAQKFQAAVKTAHPNLLEEEGVLTGRTFGAEEAVRLNMINRVGSMKEAMQVAKALAEAYNLTRNN